MSGPHDSIRRSVMTALAGLPLGAAAAATASRQLSGASRSTTLVAYFSRSGNTRVVAGLIQRAVGADLFEILPATPYPDEYLATVEQARQERDNDVRPALATQVGGMTRYDTVFLGFPIWGETAPPVIRTFLSTHDLTGKTLIPFITHGGYGPGSSQTVLARHAPKARLRSGFVMEGEQERRTMNKVGEWLKKAGLTT